MQITKFFNLTIVLLLFVVQTVTIADELVHHNNKGQVINQYQCDKVSVYKSVQQDTLICAKKARIAMNYLSMRVINDSSNVRHCQNDKNCVILDNQRDPHWTPIALYGIPDAVFGRNANGASCAVIRESKPADGTWASSSWRLCTNDPNVELAYTYALGYQHENVASRFKDKHAKRVCFDDVLRGYKYREFWKDNCIFIRRKLRLTPRQ